MATFRLFAGERLPRGGWLRLAVSSAYARSGVGRGDTRGTTVRARCKSGTSMPNDLECCGTSPPSASAHGQDRRPLDALLSGAEAKAFTDDISYKTAVGIGLPELFAIDLDVRGYAVQIVDPLPGSPADHAGLKTGDIVETIDGKPTEGGRGKRSWPSFVCPKGRRSNLGVRNRQEGLHTLKLKSEPLGGAGTRRRTGHRDVQARHSAARLHRTHGARSVRALDSLEAFRARARSPQQPGRLGDVDARRGGPLRRAQAGARHAGAERRGRNISRPSASSVTPARSRFASTKGSASAAEALALALRYTKRATIVGRKTFGKCLVHDIVPMNDGRALLMTIGRLHAPGQRPVVRRRRQARHTGLMRYPCAWSEKSWA